jgi:hypothetical protein
MKTTRMMAVAALVIGPGVRSTVAWWTSQSITHHGDGCTPFSSV